MVSDNHITDTTSPPHWPTYIAQWAVQNGLSRELEEICMLMVVSATNIQGYRYLVYPIDKHQSSPTLTNTLPWWVEEDSQPNVTDFANDVVVDLQTGKRFFRGEWAEVDTDQP